MHTGPAVYCLTAHAIRHRQKTIVSDVNLGICVQFRLVRFGPFCDSVQFHIWRWQRARKTNAKVPVIVTREEALGLGVDAFLKLYTLSLVLGLYLGLSFGSFVSFRLSLVSSPRVRLHSLLLCFFNPAISSCPLSPPSVLQFTYCPNHRSIRPRKNLS